ncbi:hypothetical protein AB0N20_22670 [Streptomyces griseoincarnatus]
MMAPAAPPRRVITAAASRYTSRKLKGRGGQSKAPDSGWQERAWAFYDSTPEVRFAAQWISGAMSAATLYAGYLADDGKTIEPAPDNSRAAEIVAAIAGGPEGQAQLLGRFGPHLVVPGEGWIVVRPKTEGDGQDWHVLSVQEMRQQGQKLVAEIDGEPVEIPPADPDGGGEDTDPIGIRVWQPHPRRFLEADSPVRASLGLLEELHLLNAAVAAIARSRLTGRGVLLVPQGTRFPSTPVQGDAEDDLIEVFMEVAETAYREPESAAATVPIILEVPAEHIAAIKRLTFESDFDELALKLREEAIRRFATGLDTPAEVVLGMGDSNHWCTLPSVEIMTASGWKTYDQLHPGEPVLTLNHETGLSEWQPLQKVNTWDVTDEPMVKIEGKRHTSVTTARHRWPILTGKPKNRGRAWTTSAELADAARQDGPDAQREEYLILAAPSADLPTEPKYSDALVELIGWFFTEGSAEMRPGRSAPRVSIYQSRTVNPDNCTRIERALTALYGPESATLDKGGRYASPESVARRAEAKRLHRDNPRMTWTEIGRRLGVSGTMAKKYVMTEAKLGDDVPRWRRTDGTAEGMNVYKLNSAAADVILEHAPNRVVTLDFVRALTAAQLELFINTAVRGDGYMNGNAHVLGQKDPAMVAAFELALILSGRNPYTFERRGMGRTANGPRERVQHTVSGSRRTTFAPRGRSFTEENYTGTIWCPTTSNGTWLARHEGTVFFTGNSAWALKEEAVTLGVQPRLDTVSHALTTQWLRPLLQADRVKDADRYVVATDTAGLRVRGNRSQTALEVFKAGAISAAALRRETGFDESDAPTAEEEARRRTEEQPPGPEDGQDQEQQDQETDVPVDETEGEPDTLPASATPAGLSPAVLEAADSLIWTALAAAGSKLKKTPACPRSERSRAREIEPARLHTVLRVEPAQVEQWRLLDGAWPRLPEVAARHGLDPECLAASLDTYCRELIAAGIEHSWDLTPGALRTSCLAVAA